MLINYNETPLVEPTEAEIRERAYQLWLAEGRPEGRDQEHWQAARLALLNEALEKGQVLAGSGPDSTHPLKATVKLRGGPGGQPLKVDASPRGAQPRTTVGAARQRPRAHAPQSV
jgi:hypothetical protein